MIGKWKTFRLIGSSLYNQIRAVRIRAAPVFSERGDNPMKVA
jgi:hypothetical protein